eukprot:s52_g13.t1
MARTSAWRCWRNEQTGPLKFKFTVCRAALFQTCGCLTQHGSSQPAPRPAPKPRLQATGIAIGRMKTKKPICAAAQDDLGGESSDEASEDGNGKYLLGLPSSREIVRAPMTTYLLYESAAGYALFLKKEFEETAETEEEVQNSLLDPKKVSKIVSLHAWTQFRDAEDALNQANSIAAGIATEELVNFLEMNLPKKKKTYQLGVYDPELGKALAEQFPIAHGQSVKEGCCLRSLSDADTDPPTPPPVLAWPHQELLRGCRLHFNRLVKDLNEGDLDKARLGLGHAFSRARMQLDPNRQETTP